MRPILNLPIRPVLLLSLVCAMVSPARAQDFAGADIAQIEGKLEAIAGNKLKIKAGAEEIFGLMDNKTKLTYTNTAELTLLRPGTTVRFTADFDTTSGIPTAPLSEIEVFRQARRPRMSRSEIQDQTPGIYPQKKEGANNSGAVQTFKIVGTIRAFQNKKFQIVAGRPLMVDLAEGATITVKAGDTTFCAPGDKIKITGLRNPNQPNFVQLQSVEIEGEKPLGKMPSTRRSRTNRREDPKKTPEDSKTKPQDADKK